MNTTENRNGKNTAAFAIMQHSAGKNWIMDHEYWDSGFAGAMINVIHVTCQWLHDIFRLIPPLTGGTGINKRSVNTVNDI